MDKQILEKNFDIFNKSPYMQLILYFHGFGQFDQSRSVFYGKSGPASAEDVIEDIKVYPNYMHIKYTNRGKGDYFNDMYISLQHITVIHSTKNAIEIYIGNPKIFQAGK